MDVNRIKLEQFDVFALMASAMASPPLGERQGNHRERAPAAARDTTSRRGFFERLDRWFWEREQREIEAYLARSTDIHDLEQRIRDMERGTLARHY